MLEFLQSAGKDIEGKLEDDRDMVIKVEGIAFVRNLGEREMLRFMRVAVFVCVM